jgi:Tol biopolymer transport system component
VVPRGLWRPVAAVGGVILAVVVYALFRPLAAPILENPQALTNDGLEKGGLATDGQRLYFTEREPTGELALKQISVSGGEPSSILSPPSPAANLGVSDVSPDYSSLLLSRATGADTPIWLLPLPGGSPRRLENLLGHDATWSPDGRRIAYCSGNKLYVANQDGGKPNGIAAVGGETFWPRWSPDGSRLRFTESSPRAIAVSWFRLWEVLPDGGGRHPLLQGWDNPPREGYGTWTPDSNYFVFESDRGGKEDIWAIREKGFHWRSHEPVKLMVLPQSCTKPVLSPDGKRIFFGGRTEQGHLERFSPVEQQFVDFLGGISAESVTFSPDGAWVAYVKYPDGSLRRMRRNGAQCRQLTFLPTKVHDLAWSPDGTQIAFSAGTAANLYKNYVVAAEGGDEPRVLQPGHSEMEGIPSWSADGKKIAFGDVPEEFGHGTKRNVIHILDLSTGKSEVLPGSEGFWSPRWSPDGQYIAALKDDDPDPDLQSLWLCERRTGKWQNLQVDHVRGLVWSDNAKYIYYDGEAGHDGIFRIRIPDGRPELVTNTNKIRRAGGYWFGLTPDDSPMILRDTGMEEIYSAKVNWP